MLFQLVLTKFLENELFSYLAKVDHSIMTNAKGLFLSSLSFKRSSTETI